ncbi:mechanosensitive ion channel family protein [Sphingomonas solaris]|uniref:Mechanosensitive ion channel family protein n=1 Tax=Alterirhizorhabdus solaris TaxID=2529389 RepID=A0A558QSK7_9SPHN|nr:mechanosensitive ion channel family protein [Sphingomonas solaris]TVV70052.1 mechanosensitive ion channel family protein [Sphingomonas solaris]
MTTKTDAAAAKAATLPKIPPIDRQIELFWQQSSEWASGHIVQIIAGCVIAVVIVAILLGVKALGVRMCRTDATHTQWRTVIGRAFSKTKLWFMVAVAAELVSGYAEAPGAVASTIRFIFTIATTLQAAIWARELILGIIEHRAGGTEEHSGLGSAMGIIRLLVTIALFAIATILILDNLGVNVTGLVAGLGIGGIAIGLAAQGIFSDLFAALAILFDKPFRRGDSVRWDTTSGTVEAIGLKTTRVRALTGEEVVISNANLLNKELHNMARLDRRRHVLTIGVIYQTPPETCAKIPEMIRAIVEGQPKCTLVRCGMTAFGASSLDYELQFDVHSQAYEEVFSARSAVCIAILKAFNEAGIEFAYPTQTSFTAAPDGRAVMPYPEQTRLVADHDLIVHGEPKGERAPA